MPLLIDAYNVLHVVGVLPPEQAGLTLEGLINLIRTSRYAAEEAELACDGTRHPQVAAGTHAGGITVSFSGGSRTADDLIRDRVNESSAPRRLTVVSSDQAVIRSARRRRCRTMPSETFLAQIAEDANLPRPGSRGGPAAAPALSERQVEGWIQLFDLGAEDLAALAAAAADEDQGPPGQQDDPDAENAAASDPRTPPTLRPRGPALPPDIVREAEQMLEDAGVDPPPPTDGPDS